MTSPRGDAPAAPPSPWSRLPCVALTGCTGGSAAAVPEQGFVSGDGTVTRWPSADRKDPVSFSGTTLDGQPYDVARRPRRGRRGQRLGVLVRAVHRRGAGAAGRARADAGPGRVVRRHQHQGRRGRGARAREALRRHLPEHRRRRRAGAARPARHAAAARRSRRRWCWTARAGWLRASSARPTATVLQRSGRRRRSPRTPS